METITAGRAIVDVLKAEGVRYVFGLPGGHVLGIYDALYDSDEISHVLVRHEHAAASAQLTGEPGVCLVTAVLPVAAEYRLGVTWCVLNDGALGSIRDIQQYRFDDRILGTEFTVQPDFAMIAKACGCHGERVEDPEALDEAVARALQANQRGVPAVLDVAVARERLLGSLEHYTFYPEELVARHRGLTPAGESLTAQAGER